MDLSPMVTWINNQDSLNCIAVLTIDKSLEFLIPTININSSKPIEDLMHAQGSCLITIIWLDSDEQVLDFMTYNRSKVKCHFMHQMPLLGGYFALIGRTCYC